MSDKRFFRTGDNAITYSTNEEIANWLFKHEEIVTQAWIEEMEKLARGQASWGMMVGMREQYNHIVDVLSLLKKMRHEDIYEGK